MATERCSDLVPVLVVALGVSLSGTSVAGVEVALEPVIAALRAELAPGLTAEDARRLDRGLAQVARFWTPADGDGAAFEGFVRRHFARSPGPREAVLLRFERLLEQTHGHMAEISRELRVQVDLDAGPILPVDEAFAAYEVSAHLGEDFFRNKLAFAVLLNFPLTTLEERLVAGVGWSRTEWAEARLAGAFSKRIPAEVNLEVARAAAEAERYIAEYNIWANHLVDANGQRLFPSKMRLLSHWNIRDQIKADYREPATGLARQRLLAEVLERIVTQAIPASVIDNPTVDWDPAANRVAASVVRDADAGRGRSVPASADAEPATRYRLILETFKTARLVDPHSPTAPTLIARRFDEHREIPEARVRAMLEQVLGSPLLAQVARLVERRLGRKLEPFDIWYDGLRPKGGASEAELDSLTKKRYATAAAFEADLPRILRQLGFGAERAESIASAIAVDPARGSGHAMGAEMRTARARLRTRVEPDGMNYKGFNIAVHELGHNVEQTISLRDVDHWLLRGVPNAAFTEAIAMLFQARDLELLGLPAPDAESEAERAVGEYWATAEISAVSLVDMGMWHWMYEHRNATPAELKQATLRIAAEVWNRYYAPVIGRRDVVLLAVYSHMVNTALYLPDYAVGHLIAAQVEEAVRGKGSLGAEVERMARIGGVVPDVWMTQATGAPVGAEALLRAAERGFDALERRPALARPD
jgi:hypothetical protein